MSRPIQQRFGKLSPTNGGAIQVYSDALGGKTIRARLLLKNGNWWYFPERHLELLGISRHCNLEGLQLRRATSGKLCLYIGIAKNLRERIKWHAEQRLSQSALRSRALSTLRFSLIALGKLNYNSGDDEINRLMDELNVSWVSTRGKPEAEAIESSQLSGDFRFALNIRGNHRVETARFVKYLKEQRKTYRRRHLD